MKTQGASIKTDLQFGYFYFLQAVNHSMKGIAVKLNRYKQC